MKIDISKPLYCIDKDTKEKLLVDAIFFPLGKPSGKDVAVVVEEESSEWRAIEEVIIIDNTKRVGD